jgi:hypothetical protein
MSEGMNNVGKMSQGNKSIRTAGAVGLKDAALERDAREKGTNERATTTRLDVDARRSCFIS